MILGAALHVDICPWCRQLFETIAQARIKATCSKSAALLFKATTNGDTHTQLVPDKRILTDVLAHALPSMVVRTTSQVPPGAGVTATPQRGSQQPRMGPWRLLNAQGYAAKSLYGWMRPAQLPSARCKHMKTHERTCV